MKNFSQPMTVKPVGTAMSGSTPVVLCAADRGYTRGSRTVGAVVPGIEQGLQAAGNAGAAVINRARRDIEVSTARRLLTS